MLNKKSLHQAEMKTVKKINQVAEVEQDSDLSWNTSGNDNNFSILKSLIELVSSITRYLHVTKPNSEPNPEF
jgi:hypothetical protein